MNNAVEFAPVFAKAKTKIRENPGQYASVWIPSVYALTDKVRVIRVPLSLMVSIYKKNKIIC